MPRSKAQQLERLRHELQKSQAALKAFVAQSEVRKARFISSLSTWIVERDRRNEAMQKKAIRLAIANVSLGPEAGDRAALRE